jgi:hypothetical protein
MLSVILFVIYLVLVSVLRYKKPQQPQQQSLDRFIAGIDEVMQTDFPVVSPAVSDENSVAPQPLTTVLDENSAAPQPLTTVLSQKVEEKQEFFSPALQSLPTSLRGVRAYIIENSLQSHIRELIGKSYSHCKLAELQLALSQL